MPIKYSDIYTKVSVTVLAWFCFSSSVKAKSNIASYKITSGFALRGGGGKPSHLNQWFNALNYNYQIIFFRELFLHPKKKSPNLHMIGGAQ